MFFISEGLRIVSIVHENFVSVRVTGRVEQPAYSNGGKSECFVRSIIQRRQTMYHSSLCFLNTTILIRYLVYTVLKHFHAVMYTYTYTSVENCTCLDMQAKASTRACPLLFQGPGLQSGNREGTHLWGDRPQTSTLSRPEQSSVHKKDSEKTKPNPHLSQKGVLELSVTIEGAFAQVVQAFESSASTQGQSEL